MISEDRTILAATKVVYSAPEVFVGQTPDGRFARVRVYMSNESGSPLGTLEREVPADGFDEWYAGWSSDADLYALFPETRALWTEGDLTTVVK